VVLLLTGLLDDYLSLSSLLRLIVQTVTTGLMIVITGTQIGSVCNLLGSGPILVGAGAGVALTVLCTVGVINSVNMIDGLDGLAASVLAISFFALAILAAVGGHKDIVIELLIINGALLGFFLFNARIFVNRAKVFMGDSGSMLLGFLLCWYTLTLSQGAEASISPISAGWIFGLPLADTASVIIRRLINGNSPFQAGRDHFHHLLQDTGLKVNTSLLIMTTIHLLFVTVGVLASLFPMIENYLFWIFIVIVFGHCSILTPFLKQQAKSTQYPQVC